MRCWGQRQQTAGAHPGGPRPARRPRGDGSRGAWRGQWEPVVSDGLRDGRWGQRTSMKPAQVEGQMFPRWFSQMGVTRIFRWKEIKARARGGAGSLEVQ